MTTPVLIDTDPGIDDAMAILFALSAPELDVLGLTTVFGNVGLEQATRNALRILEVAERSAIPVASGAARPLVRPGHAIAPSIHGADGLGDTLVRPAEPPGRPLDTPAWDFIARTVLERSGEVTLIALGPLTNLALALHHEPRLASAVREVVVMGGAAFVRGNASPVAEANIHEDPDAAALVFSADWPIVMVGLDVTHQVVMSDDYLTDLSRAGNPRTDFIAQILPAYRQFNADRYPVAATLPPYRAPGLPTHDPTAIAYVVDASLFQTTSLPLWVETDGRVAGQTVPDPHHFWGDAPLVRVCLEVEAPRLLELYRARLQAGA